MEPAAYSRQIIEFGRGLRESAPTRADGENATREAFMRRCILEVLKKHKPDKVLVVCGAFHAAGLNRDLPPLDDRQFQALPQVECSLTLMPYSYYRLSSQSGYGAGNHAPWYFQRIFEERHATEPSRLAARFLTELVHVMRKAGQVRCAAEVIESVRLAQSLAALAGSSAPCLRDLRDAAITCLGRGEEALLAPFLADVEIGSSIGKLPRGIGKTAIQDDFYLTLGALKLERFQVDKKQDLELDLRENRFVKGEVAAFRDLNISTFLHRLKVLGVEFGTQEQRQQEGTAKEKWTLRWRPECEIQLVEAALKGDSIEVAAAVALSERLADCQTVDAAAALVHDAATCQLAAALEDARQRLQAMAVDATNVTTLAKALDKLEEIIGFGTVRKIDPEPLKPLLAQLFLRATLSVQSACNCDRHSATPVGQALQVLHKIAGGQLAGDLVDGERWYGELAASAAADHLNPFLSGLACSMLLEVNRLTDDALAREVSRRLSPGVDAELGAGWFEGLVHYNRFGLFGRLALWRQLDAYIVSLDDEAFRKALVYLRRAFGSFETGEMRRVVSNLVTVSEDSADELKASADVKSSAEETAKLNEALGDLEF